MEKRLTADLNVVANSNLEIQLLDGDLNIIQKLDDEPNDVGGLTSAELKAKFDESGNIIKKYINETLIPAVLTDDATEESRKQAEAARVAAEQGRVTAEEGRVSTEAARAAAEQARSEAEASRVSAENARETAEQARANETAGIVARATEQANAAAGSASQAAGSEQSAKDAAGTATGAASSASQSAAAASGSASQASAAAAAAAQSAANGETANKNAQSWAVGGTGTRPGEDTNNAKYWAEHAEAVAGGDFATKSEAQGYVTAHNENVEAHHDLRVAVAGSVRYDTAQSLTDAQKAQARGNIGAAPGGFGLGGNAKWLTEADDVNAISESGWYAWDSPHTPKNAINVAYSSIMRVDAQNKVVNSKTIYGVVNAKPYPIVVRNMTYGSFVGEWEYENPPMNLNVEYRTTERYLGKPVYVKTINMGNLPGNAVKRASFQSNNVVDKIVSVTGQCTTDSGVNMSMPYHTGSGPNWNTVILIGADGSGAAQIVTFAPDFSEYKNACITVKYTKLAD